MPVAGKGKTLIRLFGVPIRINASWLLLAALVLLSLGRGYFPKELGPGWPWHVYWGLALVGALGLFTSLVIHEMAHSLVARATGMPVSGITLFIFGGVSQLEDEPSTAGSEFVMAAVGPASSVALGGLFTAAHLAGAWRGWPPPGMALLQLLSLVNFMLAGFNSFPAFPLDGGRVLRSLLWGVTGNLLLATRVAAGIGSVMGLGMVVVGILVLANTSLFIYGVWPIVLGFFLWQAAQGSLRMVVIRESLAGATVRQFMTPGVVTVPRDLSVAAFVRDYVFRYGFSYYPVVDASGRMVGLVSARAPRRVNHDLWPETRVGPIMQPVGDDMLVRPDTGAIGAFTRLRLAETQRAVVVEDGRPVGMLSVRDVLGFLELKSDLLSGRRHAK